MSSSAQRQQCSVCGASFRTAARLQKHVQRAHEQEDAPTCENAQNSVATDLPQPEGQPRQQMCLAGDREARSLATKEFDQQQATVGDGEARSGRGTEVAPSVVEQVECCTPVERPCREHQRVPASPVQAGNSLQGQAGAGAVHGEERARDGAVGWAAIECSACGLTFPDAEAFHQHLAWVLPQEECHVCSCCERTFANERALKQHLEMSECGRSVVSL